MSQLIKFFKSKHLEKKFSKLGEGHRLDDTSQNQSNSTGVPRADVSSKSAEAAMSRMATNVGKPKISHQVSKIPGLDEARLEAIKAEEQKKRCTQKIISCEKPFALPRVLFWCPSLLQDTIIGSREQIDQAINDYLLSESSHNLLEAAVLILIRGIEMSKIPATSEVPISELPTVSEVREKRKQNFIRILQNLIQSPDNPTYRRLRVGNQLVQDLLSVDGAELFFQTCKFNKQMQPIIQTPMSPGSSESDSHGSFNEEVSTEPFLVISEEDAHNAEYIRNILELLNTAEPIMPQLYRDTKLFQVHAHSSIMPSRDDLPDEYFYQTKEELKRTLDYHQRIVEESGMLLTKAMRERLKIQEIRLFRYALIRVRLPDDLILQGTFYANDRLSALRVWISACLENEHETYRLYAPPTVQTAAKFKVPLTARVELDDGNSTLIDLGLAPCSLLTLAFDNANNKSVRLRPDLLATIGRL